MMGNNIKTKYIDGIVEIINVGEIIEVVYENKSNKFYDFYFMEVKQNNVWYHGTYDLRQLKSGFVNNEIEVSYIVDIDRYDMLQTELKKYTNKEQKYFTILDDIGELHKQYKFNSPVFLTNIYKVAKTYANPHRAFDYQNSEPGVLTVSVKNGKTATINAHGDRFRFISVDKVKEGFIKSGVSEAEIDKLIRMFNFTIPKEKKGIMTDTIAAIGSYLKFDMIDAVGVLDSYHGGSIKSTVRMVLDANDIIIK